MLAPVASSPVELQLLERRSRLQQGHAATGDDALFDGGLALRTASSMRCLRSLELHLGGSTGLITATPPASLARRSCSFSRS